LFDSTRIEIDWEDRNNNPSKLLEEKELNRSIYHALNKLSADKRMIVVLHEMEDKTLEEIAQIMKKPLGTIKSRLFHGRKALEKHLRGCNAL
jgi:RNA polymerase sigma-70 factor (ECF subfamily)